MRWEDTGCLLHARPWGENAAIYSVLTRDHGRYSGLSKNLRAGPTRKSGKILVGSTLKLRWQARLSQQLGIFAVELVRPPDPALLLHGTSLQILTATLDQLHLLTPERMPLPALYESWLRLGAALDLGLSRPDCGDDRQIGQLCALVRFELDLLQTLGYGLRLDCCAVTGAREGLRYVSPNTGRAATREAGRPWATRLLPLPEFLCAPSRTPQQGPAGPSPDWQAVREGLELTAYFLRQWLYQPLSLQYPGSRARITRLVEEMEARHATADPQAGPAASPRDGGQMLPGGK